MGKKKKSRPTLAQMPSDAFQHYDSEMVDPVSPFTGSFEWTNPDGTASSVPNSMLTPNPQYPLGSPTNLFTPGGSSLLDLDSSDL